jgi:hypothetical protein
MAEQESKYFSRETLEAACRHYDDLAASGSTRAAIEQADAMRRYADVVLNAAYEGIRKRSGLNG